MLTLCIYNDDIDCQDSTIQMWNNLKSRFERLVLRSKFANPRKVAIGTGIFSYLAVMGIWMYRHPQALQQSTTKTVHQLSRLPIPAFARSWVYTLYSKRYAVDLQEVQKPLNEYQNLNQFFTRKLKNRQIVADSWENNLILSPSDSTVLSISQVKHNQSLIVKGITYSLSQLLYEVKDRQDTNICEQLKKNQNSQLYQVILYLSPGDYHRFHSPTKLEVRAQRNIQGKLRPVNLKSIQKFANLVYEENSRKVLHSVYRFPNQKADNYFGLAFIAALNVSDTEIYHQNIFDAGEQIGKFNMGSTIVMLFEVQGEVKWKCEEGDKIKYGSIICQLDKKE